MADFAFPESAAGAVLSTVKAPVTNQFVTFNCGDRAFGVDIMSVREIRRWSPTLELAWQPRGGTGVLDIRGSVVQVYYLGVMIGGQGIARDSDAGQVVLVVSIWDQDVGILVDSVSDIIFADGEDLRPAPGSNAAGGPDLVSGLAKIEDRLIAILDLGALFPAALS